MRPPSAALFVWAYAQPMQNLACGIGLSPRHGRACRGHPRLSFGVCGEAWMAGTRPAMTWRDGARRTNPISRRHTSLFTRWVCADAKPPFCASAIFVARDSAASCAAVSPSEAAGAGVDAFDVGGAGAATAWVLEMLDIALISHPHSRRSKAMLAPVH